MIRAEWLTGRTDMHLWPPICQMSNSHSLSCQSSCTSRMWEPLYECMSLPHEQNCFRYDTSYSNIHGAHLRVSTSANVCINWSMSCHIRLTHYMFVCKPIDLAQLTSPMHESPHAGQEFQCSHPPHGTHLILQAAAAVCKSQGGRGQVRSLVMSFGGVQGACSNGT